MNVKDFDIDVIRSQEYDMVIFSSGYEARCIHAPKQIEDLRGFNSCTFGFKSYIGDLRKTHDKYYEDVWNSERLSLSADEAKPIYDCLNEKFRSRSRPLKLLIDYSSMSRLWYAAILNWCKFSSTSFSITLDFIYSLAKYDKSYPRSIVINRILAIPGFEGDLLHDRIVSVFGLGYSGLMTQCILEQLEPDELYSYYASPGVSEDSENRVVNENRDIIDHSEHVLKLPIRSVETTVRYLAELVIPNIGKKGVILIPMGPKPHVLAALLVSVKHNKVANFRVSTQRDKPEEIMPTGEILLTRVSLDNQVI